MSDEMIASVLVTGSSRGIGLELVKTFLKRSKPPQHVFATCKNPTGAQEFIPLLKQATQEGPKDKMCCSKASVINITSELGSLSKIPNVFLSFPAIPYSCSKAALNMLTRLQAETYKKDGILFVAIHPGWVQTDMGGPQELKKFSEKHENVIVIRLDSTDSASINATVKQVEKHLNGKNLDLLINNAGVLNPQSLETQTAEDMLQVYNINVVGPMLVTQAFHHLLKRYGEESNAKSAIIHISSLLGSIEGVPKMFSSFPVISYRCSKAALNMLACCHAVGYKQDGIISLAIHPGWVRTDMGGSQALLSKEESVGEIMKIISSLNETQSGTFVDYKGIHTPW
uniref:Uncharacterized protein n=1 Tax=Leptobrachium leishanense TaxID=445787 RepID=A0A8C5MRB3_9ANUR